MKIQNILLTITVGISLAFVVCTSAEAMDTDVYLHTQSTATVGAPNVLLILDNSGSMTECPDGSNNCSQPLAYNSSIDYCNSATLDSASGVTGASGAIPANCSSYANRIYYIADGKGAPALTSTQWFAASKNNCFASKSSLSSPGFYTGDQIAYWTGAKWAMLLDGGGILDSKITYVDCFHDNSKTTRRGTTTASGAVSGDGKSPPNSGSTPYISGTTGLFSYTGNTVGLYSSNYLAFLNNYVLASTGGTKIQVAKQALIDLINANKSVRFGLMVFNTDNSGGGSVTCLSASCSGGRVIFSLDDMDDQRRADMATVISQINAATNTPLSETLYEAYRYYSGLSLLYGNDEYDSPPPVIPRRDLTAETYTTTTTGSSTSTTTTDSNGDTVYVVPSSETYIAPTEFTCQKSNIIIVTDGDPTNDTNANTNITKLLLNGTSKTSCTGLIPLTSSGAQMTYTNASGQQQTMQAYGSDCLDVLAGWMGQSPVALSGGITTYTVGFGTGLSATGYNELYNAATFSGGIMATATSASALNAALNANLAKIQAYTTSFSAPSLSINAFNKQFDNDYIYLSLFFPASTVAWDGNVKKYRLCTDADITLGKCTALTDVLDVNGNKVLDTSGNFLSTAQSYWSPSADGANIDEGGAGANVPAFASRNMYTYYSSGSYSGLTSPSAGVAVSTASSNTFYTAMVANPTLLGLPTGSTSTQVQNLINWILGQDSYNPSNATGERPWTFGDPLHSTVTPVTMGKDSSGNPIIKMIVGDNDGIIRMINENTGVEEWSFLPQELYSMQYSLSQNGSGNHLYGVDSAPSVWVQDINGDGIISPSGGDHVYMYVGMRRGGRNIYAFDITPDHTLTSQTDKSATPPKLMWVINGGSGSFANLGETWSQPQRVRVRFSCPTSGTNLCNDNNPNTDDTNSREVLLFAGGYDPHQDTAIPAGVDTMGNAIYMVDPFTGSLIWWASSNTSANLVLPKMLYSIPSDLRLVDSDGDGNIDRIYVGDTGGQLWRIDLGTSLGATGNVNGGSTGYVFADVGCGSGVLHQTSGACPTSTAVQDIRKFFYPPDRAPVADAAFSTIEYYDLITIGSGDREDPLDLLTATRVTPANSSGNEPVHNRLYAFRDCNYGKGSPTMDCITGTALSGSTMPTPFTETNLYDATSNAIGTDTGTSLATDISTLSGDNGWYINLEALTAQTLPNGLSTQWIGEKALAATEIFQGVLLATTYTPSDASSSTATCQPSTGTGTEYAINALNATAASGVTTTSGDRAGSVVVGSGIPSQVVIVVRPDGTTGLIDAGNNGGVPATAQGIQGTNSKPLYWYQK